jgi:hypothetical protein
MGEHDTAQRTKQSTQSDPGNESVADEGNADAYVLLAQLARNEEGVTPDSVAALLARYDSERMRNSILIELSAKWGNSAVQRTLAAERRRRAHPEQLGNGSRQALSSGKSASASHGPDKSNQKAKQPTDAEWGNAQSALQVAADVLQHERRLMIADAPAQYTSSLWLLHAAVTGKAHDGTLSGTERLNALDKAKAGLGAAIALYDSTDDGRAWLQEQLLSRVATLHDSLRFAEAKARVKGAVRVGKQEVIEVASDKHPREQGGQLHTELQKLVSTIGMVNEQVIRLKHDGIHHEAEALMEGHVHGRRLGPGTLLELQTILWTVDAWLTLTDEEFAHHLGDVHGVFNGVSTYSELVKVVAELAGGAISLTASYTAAIAKLAGDTSAAAAATGLARSAGILFGDVIAGIEVIHGIAVLLDPHATSQEKVDGAVGASSGLAWLIGSRTAGIAVGFAASSAILLGYAELKLMAHLYWEANIGLTAGLMRLAYETIQRDGEAIARGADELAKVGLLRQSEKDPEKAAALQRVEATLIAQLGASVDYFIDDCKPKSSEAGVAKYPGAYTILQEVFAPVMKHRRARTLEAVTEAAKVALDRITWSMAHASELITASARRKHLGDVEQELAKKEHEGKE